MISKLQQIFGELRNRRVFRTVGAYIALIWVLSQGFYDLFPIVGFPNWSLRFFVAVSVLAIPVVIALAWKYEITARGIKAVASRPAAIKAHRSVRADQLTVATGSAGGFMSVTWEDFDQATRTQNFATPCRNDMGSETETGVRH
jgi:hypothetical protein